MPNEHLVTCATARQFLARSSDHSTSAILPPELVNHIAGCARCRGVLALVVVADVGGAYLPAPLSCEECQARLAGWIDRELETGLAAAVYEDRAIWWHLWTCTDCAEIYTFTRALVAATRANELSLLPLPSASAFQPRWVLHSFQLSRTFLAYAFPMSNPALGGLRGIETGSMLVEDVVQGYRINLTVCEEADQHWRVSVTTVPPVAGWLVLMFGEQSFRARFDAQGLAVIGGVPVALLSETNGPDLQVVVELDEDYLSTSY